MKTTTTARALAAVYNETYAAAARNTAISLPTAHAIADLAVEMMSVRAYNQNYALVIKAAGADDQSVVVAHDIAKFIVGR